MLCNLNAQLTIIPFTYKKDVLAAIESSTRTADAKNSIIQGLGEEVVIDYPNPTGDGVIQNMILVHESAAYFLLARSRTDKGKDFNLWLFKEVVPAIHNNQFTRR